MLALFVVSRMKSLQDKTVVTSAAIASDRQWMELLTGRFFPPAERYVQNNVNRVKYYDFECTEFKVFIHPQVFNEQMITCIRMWDGYRYNAIKGFYGLLLLEFAALEDENGSKLLPPWLVLRANQSSFITQNASKNGICINSHCQALKHNCKTTFVAEILFEDIVSGNFVPILGSLSPTRCDHIEGFPYGTCVGDIRKLLAEHKPRAMIMKCLEELDVEEYFYMNRTVCPSCLLWLKHFRI